MKLKAFYENQSDIPADYRELFTERDGKLELTGIDGVRTQADVDRLQDSLRKERADHKAAREKLAATNESDPQKHNRQVSEMRPDNDIGAINVLQQQLSESQSTIADLNQALSQGRVKDEIRKAALEQNILPVALDDVLLLAEQTFEIRDDGQSVTKNIANVEAGLGAGQWLDQMKEQRPHWWPVSIGAGANGGARQFAYDNPWSRDSWNLTEQGQILRANPDRAKNLAAVAGVKLAI